MPRSLPPERHAESVEDAEQPGDQARLAGDGEGDFAGPPHPRRELTDRADGDESDEEEHRRPEGERSLLSVDR